MCSRRLSVLLVAWIALAGCSEPAPVPERPPRSVGLVIGESRFGYDATVRRLDSVLQAAAPVDVVARVDHTAHAERTDHPLRPTHVALFGNPALGTPLLQHNPLVGLDLPQKVLVYATPDGRAILTYNSTDYLAHRYGLGGVATLPRMAQALRSLAEQATVRSPRPTDSTAVAAGAGIVQVESLYPVDETFRRLKRRVEAHGVLTVVAELDHAANAERVNLKLPPARLLVFSHPLLEALLIADVPTLALDLPQKILVYRAADGTTHLAYNDPFFLAERHGATDQQKRLRAVRDGLDRLARQAAGNE